MLIKVASLVLLLNISSLVVCDVNSDVDVLWLEQSIDANQFKEIGNFNLRTIRQNQNTAQFQSYNSLNEHLHESDQPKYHNVQFSTPIETNNVDLETKSEIRGALERSNSSLYRLRLCKKVPEYECSSASFIYLKKVAESNYQINLTVYTGVNNRMASVALKTRSKKNQKTVSLNDLETITMYTSIQTIKQGQIPDTEVYVEKVKKEVEQKEKAAVGGNESFLQKYWMYIVPFVVIMFLSNLAAPEGGA